MKKALTWLKMNIVIALSVLVMIGSLVGLYIANRGRQDFNDLLSRRIGTLKEIDNLRNQDVTIEAMNEGEQDQTVTLAINQATIDKRTKANEKIQGAAAQVIDQMHELNERGHTVMTRGLFPKPADEGALHRSKVEYRRQIGDMLRPFEADAQGPRLDAGTPPEPEVMRNVLKEARQSFYAGMGVDVTKHVSTSDLSSKEYDAMIARERERLIRLLRGRAQSMHIYAANNIDDARTFPFSVGSWSAERTIGSHVDLLTRAWEGQMELWIQQDIARAIAMTNRVSDPGSSVVTAPVKELVKVKVVDGILRGWVGYNSEGGLSSRYRINSNPNPNESIIFDWFPQYGPGGMYTPFSMLRAPETKTKQRKKGVVEADFKLGPSGRNSNDYYDVHHAELKVIVDSNRMLELIENIQRVNLMTVLDVAVSDIDEYAKLMQGYYYGDDDVVEATLIIETVWLRDWLDKIAPKDVMDRREEAKTTGR